MERLGALAAKICGLEQDTRVLSLALETTAGHLNSCMLNQTSSCQTNKKICLGWRYLSLLPHCLDLLAPSDGARLLLYQRYGASAATSYSPTNCSGFSSPT